MLCLNVTVTQLPRLGLEKILPIINFALFVMMTFHGKYKYQTYLN